MTTVEPEMKALSSVECYRLLASRAIGHLGVVCDNYPLIIPVNYGLDQDIIVIRTDPGTVVARADFHNVTFQVDDLNLEHHSGWSILVCGQAEGLTPAHSPELVARTRLTDVHPWVTGERDHWMRIIPHGISGRRIIPGEDLQWSLGTAAYM